MTEAENFFVPGPAGRLSVRAKGMAGKPDKVVVLVQGSNLSGQTGYDFSFDGGVAYSMMDALTSTDSGPACGAVTFALRGYGASDPPSDPLACGTDSAVEDLRAVMDWLRAQGVAKASLLGWSWGARIIGHYVAQRAGARIEGHLPRPGHWRRRTDPAGGHGAVVVQYARGISHAARSDTDGGRCAGSAY